MGSQSLAAGKRTCSAVKAGPSLSINMIRHIFSGAMTTLFIAPFCYGQYNWQRADSFFAPLPAKVHVFRLQQIVDARPVVAYALIAPLGSRELRFTTDTTKNRRLRPAEFYEKNDQPLLVVNGTFFEFVNHRNLNVIIRNGKLLGYNPHSIALRGKDSLLFLHSHRSAIGISNKRKADIAWLFTDSSKKRPYAFQQPVPSWKDSVNKLTLSQLKSRIALQIFTGKTRFRKWRVQTAIGGGPVLVQQGIVRVTNNEENMFSGKAISDRHPRTAMGYTADGRLVVLAVQGRMPGVAEGVSLVQLAEMLISLGCVEALNLDGGGSSCLLINGKETIVPSDREGQRPVPGVFIIHQKKNKFTIR